MKTNASKSALRQYQERAANAGWRIALIPYDEPQKAMRIQTNWFAMAGAGGFCFGVWGLWARGITPPYVAAAAGGFALMLASIFLAALVKRRGWQRIQAVCLDREWHTDGEGWGFRLQCRFELEGTSYTVTPGVCWRGFRSEAALEQFLGREIAADGACWLRVNPRNPLQTELAAGLTDKLLYLIP